MERALSLQTNNSLQAVAGPKTPPLPKEVIEAAEYTEDLAKKRLLFLTDYSSNFPNECLMSMLATREMTRSETEITLFFYSCGFSFIHPLMKIFPQRKILFFCFLNLQIKEQGTKIPEDALFKLFLKLIVDPKVKLDTSIAAQDRCYTIALKKIERFIKNETFDKDYGTCLSKMEMLINAHVQKEKISAIKSIWRQRLTSLEKEYNKLHPLACKLEEIELIFQSTLHLLQSANCF